MGATSRSCPVGLHARKPSVRKALHFIDGADLKPLLAGGETLHDYLYYTTTWSGRFAGVRDRHYKYRDIVPNDSPVGAGGEPYNAKPSLYSLDLDNEAHDVSAKHTEEAEHLIELLDAFRKENAINPRGWIAPQASAASQ